MAEIKMNSDEEPKMDKTRIILFLNFHSLKKIHSSKL
jgi:hypothetical protein